MQKINIVFFTEDKSLVEKTRLKIWELREENGVEILWKKDISEIIDFLNSDDRKILIVDGHINLLNMARVGLLEKNIEEIILFSGHDSRTQLKNNIFRAKNLDLTFLATWFQEIRRRAH